MLVPVRLSPAGRARLGALFALARRVALPLVILPYATTGCYTYAALQRTPSAGTDVVLEVNDQGRVALGPRLGTMLARVEGELVQKTDTAYIVRMQQVRTLDGGTTHWAGEQVSLRDEYIVGVGERQFSRSRTVFAVVGFLAALGAVIAGQSLTGGGGGDERPGPSDGGPDR